MNNSGIKGIGVDLVELDRLPLDHTHFIERVLSKKELELFQKISSERRKREFLGSRFAAKEALLKAMGTGLGGMKLSDIEVLNLESGQPYLNIPNSHISLSHEGNMAIAFVILTND